MSTFSRSIPECDTRLNPPSTHQGSGVRRFCCRRFSSAHTWARLESDVSLRRSRASCWNVNDSISLAVLTIYDPQRGPRPIRAHTFSAAAIMAGSRDYRRYGEPRRSGGALIRPESRSRLASLRGASSRRLERRVVRAFTTPHNGGLGSV